VVFLNQDGFSKELLLFERNHELILDRETLTELLFFAMIGGDRPYSCSSLAVGTESRNKCSWSRRRERCDTSGGSELERLRGGLLSVDVLLDALRILV
jgi:hypothetical protein